MTDLKRLGETRAELKRISEALYFFGIKIGPDEKWVVILKQMLDNKDARIKELELEAKDGGMVTKSLRDHFAASALTGLIGQPLRPRDEHCDRCQDRKPYSMQDVIDTAWTYADAMIKAREVQP